MLVPKTKLTLWPTFFTFIEDSLGSFLRVIRTLLVYWNVKWQCMAGSVILIALLNIVLSKIHIDCIIYIYIFFCMCNSYLAGYNLMNHKCICCDYVSWTDTQTLVFIYFLISNNALKASNRQCPGDSYIFADSLNI